MSSTKRLGLEFMEVNQSQKEITVNEALNKLDFYVGLTVNNVLQTVPSSPEEGDAYLIGEEPSGIWADRTGQIAHYLNGVFEYYLPFEGMRIFISGSGKDYRYRTNAWFEENSSSIQVVDALPASPVSGVIYLVREV